MSATAVGRSTAVKMQECSPLRSPLTKEETVSMSPSPRPLPKLLSTAAWSPGRAINDVAALPNRSIGKETGMRLIVYIGFAQPDERPNWAGAYARHAQRF